MNVFLVVTSVALLCGGEGLKSDKKSKLNLVDQAFGRMNCKWRSMKNLQNPWTDVAVMITICAVGLLRYVRNIHMSDRGKLLHCMIAWCILQGVEESNQDFYLWCIYIDVTFCVTVNRDQVKLLSDCYNKAKKSFDNWLDHFLFVGHYEKLGQTKRKQILSQTFFSLRASKEKFGVSSGHKLKKTQYALPNIKVAFGNKIQICKLLTKISTNHHLKCCSCLLIV